MSSALPMAVFRPSCTALRTSTPVTHQWNSVTRAFARRFCATVSKSTSNCRPSLLSAVSQTSPFCSRDRAFSSTPKSSENEDRPSHALAVKKREVRIGPLPGEEPEWLTIRAIFGSKISRVDGINVLRILHHRRTSGSLADYGVDNLGSRYNAVDHEARLRAIEWLRHTYPIDEARAAEEWAEKEANRIAYELWLADPENAGSKYNDPARVFQEQQKEIEEKEAEEQESKRIGILRQGPSEFEKNIARKRRERLEAAAREAEEKERREKENEVKLATGEWVRTPSGKQLMKPGQDTYVDVFGREQVSRRKEMLEEYQKKAQTSFKTPEEMMSATTLSQRLVPMTAFVLATCVICYLAATNYQEPHPDYRMWPDVSVTTATIATIIGVNVLLCIAWRIGPLWPLLTNFFMHVPGYPRAIQSLTNVWSHVQYEHLLSNMFFFLLVGTACHELVGRGIFMGTYIAAGSVGTLASLYWANLGKGNITAHSLGASAAIWGIAALYCLLTEQESIKIPYLKDVETGFYPKALFAAFVVMEIFTARKGRGKGKADHASHFGGMAAGVGVAGYMHHMGWAERRKGESKTLDVGKMVKEEVGEVKEGVKEGVKKIVRS